METMNNSDICGDFGGSNVRIRGRVGLGDRNGFITNRGGFAGSDEFARGWGGFRGRGGLLRGQVDNIRGRGRGRGRGTGAVNWEGRPNPEDPANDWRRNIVCRYFAAGICILGNNCKYRHPEENSSGEGANMPQQNIRSVGIGLNYHDVHMSDD